MCGWSTELEGEVKGDAVGSGASPCGSGSRQRGYREPPECVE